VADAFDDVSAILGAARLKRERQPGLSALGHPSQQMNRIWVGRHVVI